MFSVSATQGGKKRQRTDPATGLGNLGRCKRNCSALPSAVCSFRPRAGLVGSRQAFVGRRHLVGAATPTGCRDRLRPVVGFGIFDQKIFVRYLQVCVEPMGPVHPPPRMARGGKVIRALLPGKTPSESSRVFVDANAERPVAFGG